MHPIDLTIMFVYLALMAAVGWWSATKASKRAESYFWQAGACRGGSSVSRTASSGVDITGAMWFVMMFYIYGVKGVWLLWV